MRFGTTSASFSVVSSTQITAIAPPGTRPVTVTVSTPGGISNGLVYTYVSTPAPQITALAPVQGSTAGGNAVVVSGSAFTGATRVSFGGAAAVYRVDSDGQITVTAPQHAAGSVDVTVTTPRGTSNVVGYTYVSVPAPHITGLVPVEGPTAGGNAVVVSGSAFSGATLVSFGGVAAVFTVDGDGQITAVAPQHAAGLVDVRVTTANGVSNAVGYTYVPAPVVNSVDPGLGPVAGGNTVTIYGTDLSLTNSVTFGPGTGTNLAVTSDNEITVTAPPGTGTVVVTVTTPGGSSPSDQGNPYYIYVPVPHITSIAPDHGPTSGGTGVLISGSGLTFIDDVSFGAGPAASFAPISDDQVVATSPAGPAGTLTVTVHSPGGTSNGLSFTYEP
ncbi:hypothetical protein Shyhy01_00440 [Streptomyces hygroscopicus subsp. hygroscopicus]|nr:hypothetical protein Shyhy01_00440 [Streptomyces hygroscopicus subsp. hygroscopicus]